MEQFFFWLWIASVYMAPTVAAFMRGKDNSAAICALNLLLGWTFVGWVVSLVWALAKDKPKSPANNA